MRVTVVPEDRYIVVDGRGLNFDFPADANIHAIQWYGDNGTVEQKLGGSRPATLPEVQPFIDAWQAESDRRAEPPPPPPPPTPDELQGALSASIQKLINDTARQRRYDDINSAAKYKDISDAEIAALPADEQPIVARYRAECRALALFAARCWAKGEVILSAVQSGQRAVPTKDALLAEMPTMEWPA